MKVYSKIIPTLFLSLLSMVAHGQVATLSIDAEPPETSLGEYFDVGIVIGGVNSTSIPAVGAYDITVSFDPSTIAYISTTFGSQLDVLGLGDIQNAAQVNSNAIELIEVSLDSAADISSIQQTNFTAATIQFEAIAAGTSSVGIADDTISDVNGNAISASVSNETINISQVPEPEAADLAAVAILVSILSNRRQRSEMIKTARKA